MVFTCAAPGTHAMAVAQEVERRVEPAEQSAASAARGRRRRLPALVLALRHTRLRAPISRTPSVVARLGRAPLAALKVINASARATTISASRVVWWRASVETGRASLLRRTRRPGSACESCACAHAGIPPIRISSRSAVQRGLGDVPPTTRPASMSVGI